MSDLPPDYLDGGQQERPGSVFSDLSSEPDRLYIDLDRFDGLGEDASERATQTPQPMMMYKNVAYGHSQTPEAAVDCRLSRPWYQDSEPQLSSKPQLFRPFSPAHPTPGHHDLYRPAQHSVTTGFCAPQLNINHNASSFTPTWLSQPPPYTSNYVSPPQQLTPDAEVSMYSWMADSRPVPSRNTATPSSLSTSSGSATPTDLYSWMSRDSSDADSRPGSSGRDTATPSSISTSGTTTPVDLDSRQPEMGHSYPTAGDQPVREPFKWKAPGKATKRKESGSGPNRTGFPYKRHGKPPYTYCGLITTAIQMSPRRRLTLSGVTHQLTKMFEFFRGPYTGWKQSVRHNLSHSPCFVKDERAERPEDEEEGEKKVGFYWRVDFTRMTHGAFCLQRTAEGRSGDYRDHIHEHLGLDPASLYGHDIAPWCRCRGLRFIFPRSAGTDLSTGRDATDFPVTHLRLPVKRECVLPTDSPDAYGTRDNNTVATNSSLNSSFLDAENLSAASLSNVSGTGSGNQATHADTTSAYLSISQFILDTDGSDWTSTAAENLSFLCSNKTVAS